MRITQKAAMLLGVVGSLAAGGTAGAQIVFAGSTQGCFSATYYVGCPSSFGGITFQGTPVNFTAPYNGVTGVGNLGYFNLPGTFTGTSPQPFTLFVTLTQPNINGAPPGNASGPISGTLTGTIGFGGQVVFAPNTFNFGFSDPNTGTSGTGIFTFSTPTGIQPGGGSTNPALPNAITGSLVTTTPEPSSMALLGTGLIGLVPMIRRRRK